MIIDKVKKFQLPNNQYSLILKLLFIDQKNGSLFMIKKLT